MAHSTQQKRKLKNSRKKQTRQQRTIERCKHKFETEVLEQVNCAVKLIRKDFEDQKRIAIKLHNKWKKCVEGNKQLLNILQKSNNVKVSYSTTGLHEAKYIPKIEPAELQEVSSCIGSGSFGQCYVKHYPRLGIHVLEKKLPNADANVVNKEACFQQMFAHRCVPCIFGINVTIKPFSLIMEFIGKELQSMTVYKLLHDKNILKAMGNMSVTDWFRVCYDVADAVHHMHEKGYLHCDLKSDNVLVSKNKTGYLIDFGKVCSISNPPAAKKYSKMYNRIAPEVLNGHPASPASDIYSLGMIILAVGQTVGDSRMVTLGKRSTSYVPFQRPSMIDLLTDLHIHP